MYKSQILWNNIKLIKIVHSKLKENHKNYDFSYKSMSTHKVLQWNYFSTRSAVSENQETQLIENKNDEK